MRNFIVIFYIVWGALSSIEPSLAGNKSDIPEHALTSLAHFTNKLFPISPKKDSANIGLSAQAIAQIVFTGEVGVEGNKINYKFRELAKDKGEAKKEKAIMVAALISLGAQSATDTNLQKYIEEQYKGEKSGNATHNENCLWLIKYGRALFLNNEKDLKTLKTGDHSFLFDIDPVAFEETYVGLSVFSEKVASFDGLATTIVKKLTPVPLIVEKKEALTPAKPVIKTPPSTPASNKPQIIRGEVVFGKKPLPSPLADWQKEAGKVDRTALTPVSVGTTAITLPGAAKFILDQTHTLNETDLTVLTPEKFDDLVKSQTTKTSAPSTTEFTYTLLELYAVLIEDLLKGRPNATSETKKLSAAIVTLVSKNNLLDPTVTSPENMKTVVHALYMAGKGGDNSTVQSMMEGYTKTGDITTDYKLQEALLFLAGIHPLGRWQSVEDALRNTFQSWLAGNDKSINGALVWLATHIEKFLGEESLGAFSYETSITYTDILRKFGLALKNPGIDRPLIDSIDRKWKEKYLSTTLKMKINEIASQSLSGGEFAKINSDSKIDDMNQASRFFDSDLQKGVSIFVRAAQKDKNNNEETLSALKNLCYNILFLKTITKSTLIPGESTALKTLTTFIKGLPDVKFDLKTSDTMINIIIEGLAAYMTHDKINTIFQSMEKTIQDIKKMEARKNKHLTLDTETKIDMTRVSRTRLASPLKTSFVIPKNILDLLPSGESGIVLSEEMKNSGERVVYVRYLLPEARELGNVKWFLSQGSIETLLKTLDAKVPSGYPSLVGADHIYVADREGDNEYANLFAIQKKNKSHYSIIWGLESEPEKAMDKEKGRLQELSKLNLSPVTAKDAEDKKKAAEEAKKKQPQKSDQLVEELKRAQEKKAQEAQAEIKKKIAGSPS